MVTRDFKIQKLFPRVKFSTGGNFALSSPKKFFKADKIPSTNYVLWGI